MGRTSFHESLHYLKTRGRFNYASDGGFLLENSPMERFAMRRKQMKQGRLQAIISMALRAFGKS